jgi:DNA polymerase III subunit epsilon
MQRYNYWGSGSNEPPAHLKTKKQLAQMGLAAVNPLGLIETKKYTIFLYDPTSPKSTRSKRQPTPKQLENLKKGRVKSQYKAWYRNGGFMEEDRAETVGWARQLLQKGCVIMDTETTGLGDAEIVEIAIISHQGDVLFNALIRPTIEIPRTAIAVHGITNEMVANAPTFPDIYPRIVQELNGKTVAIYQSDFDINILDYCCSLHRLRKFNLHTICLCFWYSRWYGEYSSYWKNYKRQPLNGGHRALGDCLAALEVLKEMVADDPEIRIPNFD